MTPARKPRWFPVPQALQSSSFGPKVTLDDMEFVATHHTRAGQWAARVLARENEKMLDRLLGEETTLPRGVLASGDDESLEIVTGLINHEGRLWDRNAWVDPEAPVARTVDLEQAEVAAVARAMDEGADGVLMRGYVPLAFVAAVEGAPDVSLPDGGIPVAIVDSFDKTAVLELLAVAPGPRVFRRHDGKWAADNKWTHVLRSVDPPPMVKLDESLLASVASQVDTATKGVKFEPFELADADGYRAIRASSSPYITQLERESASVAIDLNFALVAVAGRELSPKDIKSTEKLRQYWLHGKGAAKIRWGTPGSWRRCYRHLVKHLGPKMTPGYCTNLSERLGGQGVATHVGDRR
jgi:hypothetical protein